MLLQDVLGASVLMGLVVFAWWWVEKWFPIQRTFKKQALQSLLHLFGQWKALVIFWFGWALISDVNFMHPVEHGLLFWQYVLLATLKAALFFGVIHFLVDLTFPWGIAVKNVGALRRLMRIRFAVNMLAAIVIYFLL
jgi:hypothetical protein